MVDTEEMAKKFIERRKKHNEILKKNQSGLHLVSRWDGDRWEQGKPSRLNEKPLNENPQLLYISYKNGKGGMVIDQDELMKAPKSLQNKIFSLHKI